MTAPGAPLSASLAHELCITVIGVLLLIIAMATVVTAICAAALHYGV